MADVDSTIPSLAELEQLLQDERKLSIRAISSLGAALIKHEHYQTAITLLQSGLDDVLTNRKRPQGSLGDVYLNLGIALAGNEQHEVSKHGSSDRSSVSHRDG
jgi:hypothetical protein